MLIVRGDNMRDTRAMAERDFDADTDPDAGNPADWEPVAQPTPRKGPGIVLSVRLSHELANRLEALAASRGVSTSEAAREAITEAIRKSQVWVNRTVNLSVRDLWSATYSQGDSSVGGESKVRRFNEIAS
jgi:hypothetical protein